MERATALKLLLTVAVVMLIHTKAAESQWIPHHPLPVPGDATLPPLCASQFTLVNRACSLLPYTPVPPPSPPSPAPSPPAPPSPDDDSLRKRHRHGHGHHGHGHRHRHGHRRYGEGGTDVEQECCRWLQQVDNECVCGLLVRLPSFLTRPVHNYTVVVDDTCQVSFACSSRIVPV